jgi:hypothetical protein
MIFVFVAAGIVGAAGLLVLGFGIPIKDTSFGSAMLLSSIVLVCTSLVLAGLGFVVRELKAVARALAAGGVRPAPRMQPARPGAPQRPVPQPGLAPPVDQDTPGSAAEPSAAEAQPAAPSAPLPWAAEAAARDRVRNGAPGSQPAAPPPIETAEPPAAPERPPRRNLLFATRKRDRAGAPSPASPDQPASAELPKMAPPVLPSMTALEAEPKASFDSAWPASGRGGNPFSRRNRSAEAAPSAAEPPPLEPAAEPQAPTPPAPPPPPAAAETTPGVTVIKSGVVDGMAYSLYSDGSIEAQMPEGMLRFASLDELRTHLEQRP